MVVLRYVSLLQFILIWMYILLPLLELFTDVDAANKPFPYKMRFPYDANHGISYALTYFLTSLAGFGVVTTLFSEDSLFGFFIAHTCGQFRLLHQHIDGIVRTGQLNAAKRYPGHPANGGTQRHRMQESIQREYRHALVRIIRHHNVLIRYAARTTIGHSCVWYFRRLNQTFSCALFLPTISWAGFMSCFRIFSVPFYW